MGWLRRVFHRVQDKVDPPCTHPVAQRRPSSIPEEIGLGITLRIPAWACTGCGSKHRITIQEYESLFGQWVW